MEHDASVKLSGILLDADYVSVGERSIIRLTLKAGGKAYQLFDFNFRPYFYIIPSSESITKESLEKVQMVDQDGTTKPFLVEEERISLRGIPTRALRVYVHSTRQVPKLSELMSEFGERYEYDILFWKRYLIDTKISPLFGVDITAHDENGKLRVDEIRPAQAAVMEEVTHLCFDIETYNPLGAPRPKVDQVIMVSYTDGKDSAVLTTKPIKRPFVKVFESEKAMIANFVEYINKGNFDAIAGYNSSNFDIPYMVERGNVSRAGFEIGRYGDVPDSQNHGLVQMVKIPGRVNVDVYNVAKFVSIVGASENLIKANNLKLSEVYAAITGDKKVMVDRLNIWQIWDGEDKDREELADYSLADSLALEALYKFFIPLELEISKIVGTTLGEACISTTGQLVEHLLMRYANGNNEFIPNKPNDREITWRNDNPIEGAYVKTPDAGIYKDIVVFDFRSLYPSIIIAHNIDPSTLYKGDEPGEYYESPTKAKFRKKPVGIVPDVLKLMLKERSEIKKAFKKDPDNKSLAARSTGLKIIANSFYGYLGYARSRWYSRECAESVTAFGRDYISKTMENAEQHGFRVIYGDSVTGRTQVRVQSGTKSPIAYKQIQELFEKVDKSENDGKEYYFPESLYVETLDEKGRVVLKRVKYVVRHKTTKKVYKVNLTDTWNIEVTEDHSLIGFVGLQKMRNKDAIKRMVPIKPLDIKKVANSLVVKKKSFRDSIVSRNYSKELYELMGFFIGDGSFEYNKDKKCYYLAFALGLEEDELVKRVFLPLKESGLIKSIWSRGRGDVRINGLGTVKLFEKEIRKDGKKAIPAFVFNETTANISSFLRGLFSSDGTVIIRGKKPIIRCTTIDGEIAHDIQKLLWEVGISSSIFRERTENKYRGKGSGTYSYHVYVKSKDGFVKNVGFLTLKKQARIDKYKETSLQKRKIIDMDFDISSIIGVEEIKYKDYVYDVEVEDTHRFFANGVLVHNTDSVMLLRGEKSKEDVKKFLDDVNKGLPEAMELELEDFYRSGVFVGKRGGTDAGAKKKYALLSESGRIKIRGFELVRRDWSAVSRNTQRAVLENILNAGSKESAIAIVKDVVKRLRDGKADMKELVIQTQLRKKIDNYDNTSPELAAVKKAIARGQKNKKEMEGSTVCYVVTKTGNTISEKAELEEFAKDYDAEYYISHQIIPATLKILKELGVTEEELRGLGSQKRLM